MDLNKMIAVIFAKKSERLPDKHRMAICGRPMISYISEILFNSKLFSKIILFTKDAGLECKYCDKAIDATDGILIDSLIYCIENYKNFMAVGGDMPLIDRPMLYKLINSSNGNTLPASNYGYYEPLFAIYGTDIYESIKNYRLSGNESISKFFELDKLKALDMDTFKLKSVNTYSDLLFARKSIGCDEI
ncbi:MAG: hypothetical protein QXZ44_02680 [Ferroplasma sp.]